MNSGGVRVMEGYVGEGGNSGRVSVRVGEGHVGEGEKSRESERWRERNGGHGGRQSFDITTFAIVQKFVYIHYSVVV